MAKNNTKKFVSFDTTGLNDQKLLSTIFNAVRAYHKLGKKSVLIISTSDHDVHLPITDKLNRVYFVMQEILRLKGIDPQSEAGDTLLRNAGHMDMFAKHDRPSICIPMNEIISDETKARVNIFFEIGGTEIPENVTFFYS